MPPLGRSPTVPPKIARCHAAEIGRFGFVFAPRLGRPERSNMPMYGVALNAEVEERDVPAFLATAQLRMLLIGGGLTHPHLK